MKLETIKIGRIVNAHGIRGEVRVREVMARPAVSDPDRRQAGPVPSCLTTFIGLFLCPPFPGRRRGTERWSRCR